MITGEPLVGKRQRPRWQSVRLRLDWRWKSGLIRLEGKLRTNYWDPHCVKIEYIRFQASLSATIGMCRTLSDHVMFLRSIVAFVSGRRNHFPNTSWQHRWRLTLSCLVELFYAGKMTSHCSELLPCVTTMTRQSHAKPAPRTVAFLLYVHGKTQRWECGKALHSLAKSHKIF